MQHDNTAHEHDMSQVEVSGACIAVQGISMGWMFTEKA